MANTIKIKRGSGAPSSLAEGELGFDTSNKILYCGDNNNSPVKLYGSQLDNKLSLTGGTMTGEIKIGQGDGYGIQLGTNGRINATTSNGSTTATLCGTDGSGKALLGHSSFELMLRGSQSRPTYNGSKIALQSETIPIVNAYSDDGIAYTATIEGLTSLTPGMRITIIPQIASASTSPTLNINGLGAYQIVMTVRPSTFSYWESWLGKAKALPYKSHISKSVPLTLQFGAGGTVSTSLASYWVMTDNFIPNMGVVQGTLDIYNGGTAASTAEEARTNLGVSYDILFPVGYIYMSTSSTSPASLFGGTWQQITERFLFAASQLNEDGTVNEDAAYLAGEVDGEATHTLSESEAPYKKYGMGVRPFDSGSNTDLTVYGSTNVTTSHLNDWGTWYGLKTGGVSRNYYTWVTWNYGGDGAHNNMPPYLVVYIWQRVEDTTES